MSCLSQTVSLVKSNSVFQPSQATLASFVQGVHYLVSLGLRDVKAKTDILFMNRFKQGGASLLQLAQGLGHSVCVGAQHSTRPKLDSTEAPDHMVVSTLSSS